MGWFSQARAAVAAAAAAGACLMATAPAKADPLPKGGMTLQEVDAWLKGVGFSTIDNAEHNFVVIKVGTANVVVFLGDCENQRCQSLQYFYGVHFPNGVRPDDASAALFMNGWNHKFRWAKAYATETRDTALEMDYSLTPGVDGEALNHSLIQFLGVIAVFNAYLASKG